MAGPSPTLVQTPPRQKDTARLLVILALALAALSYVNTLTFNFVYDDFPQLVNNPRLHSWQHAPNLFAEQVWTQSMLKGTGNYYRPIFELWLLAQYSVFGLHPWAYHAASVVIHIGVVVLAYLLFARLTDRLTAAMAVVVFAVHPTHIETVAWISGSTDLLCGLFVLASFLAYLRARDEGKSRVGWMAAAAFLYALAMMSKETAVVLPALLLAYEWWLAKRDGLAAEIGRVAPFAILTGIYLLVRHWVLAGFMHSEGYSVAAVAKTLPRILWFYTHQLLWPVGLSVFYDTPFVDKPGLWDFYLPLLAVVAFAGAIVWLVKKSRPAGFGAAWMVGMLAPAIVGIAVFIPEELAHDRYLYIPSVGFALLVAIAVRKLNSSGELFGGPRLQVLIVLALGGALAAETAAQNVYWTNDLILYAHGMNTAPRNVVAINHMANEMFKRNRGDAALALYRQALQIKPSQWSTYFAQGITMYELGKYQDATRSFRGAIALAPQNAEQYYFLGLSQLSLSDYAQAEDAFRQTLRWNPQRPGANNALATALLRQGKTDEAREAFRAEVSLTHDPVATRELQNLEHR